jgi:hypothetical protein
MSVDRITASECAALGSLASVVDCRRVRLYRGKVGGPARLLRNMVLRLSRNRAVALGNRVFLPDHCERDLAALAHELTHCGQYQAWGSWRYYRRGLIAQIREILHRTTRFGSSPYRYSSEPVKAFEAYGMEQQGQIVEDCFRGDPVASAISPFRPGGRAS